MRREMDAQRVPNKQDAWECTCRRKGAVDEADEGSTLPYMQGRFEYTVG